MHKLFFCVGCNRENAADRNLDIQHIGLLLVKDLDRHGAFAHTVVVIFYVVADLIVKMKLYLCGNVIRKNNFLDFIRFQLRQIHVNSPFSWFPQSFRGTQSVLLCNFWLFGFSATAPERSLRLIR